MKEAGAKFFKSGWSFFKKGAEKLKKQLNDPK